MALMSRRVSALRLSISTPRWAAQFLDRVVPIMDTVAANESRRDGESGVVMQTSPKMLFRDADSSLNFTISQ